MNLTYKAQAYQYSQDFFAVKTAEATDFANEFNLDLLDPDNVYWLNFHNLDDRSSIEKLGQKIGLDKLSIESIFLPLRRAKVEEYPKYLFFQLHTLRNNSQDTEQTDQITFVLGEHYLLSFQTNEGQHFGEVRERIEKSKGKIRNQKADFLLFRLLDALLDELFQYTIEVSDEIDRIDERIHSKMESDLLREIELQKRQLINLRKIVQPIKDLLAVLESMDNALIASTNKHYYKNLRNSCVSLLEDIDAHKQMYVPMGAGMVVFKHPSSAHAIEHHAEYILRKGSKDLGSQTLEGSRPGMAMLVHACLQVIGRDGYEILINRSLEKARYFATLIAHNIDFELITEPELCLLTYRYVPAQVQKAMAGADAEQLQRFNELLNGLTKFIQKRQREEGKSFVSRTRLTPARYNRQETIVFRVVLANPLTTEQILHDVLVEQDQIAQLDKEFYPKLLQLAKELI